MQPILEIQGISKKFRINHEAQPYLSFRDKLTNILRSHGSHQEDFWALRDINVDINPVNLLALLAKTGRGNRLVKNPFQNHASHPRTNHSRRGRIASLLEVGTGFHPELTGRENVYLNGSILGMRKKEIDAKFDEIIDFAGTEKFLDTPLKHYSSGMQLRLAFAVAAFLEPEILVVDEVLAVGDAEFQKKCLGKMEDVSKSGRTILFVSHNMAAIQSLCKQSILLHQGALISKGESHEVVEKYLDLSFSSNESKNGIVEFESVGDAPRLIKKIELYCNGILSAHASMGCQLEIKVYFSSPKILDHPVLGIIFRDSQGIAILGINNNHFVGNVARSPLARGVFSLTIKYLQFFSGLYSVDIHLGDNITDLDVRRDCLNFNVEKLPFTPSGVLPDERLNKFFTPDVAWRVD